MSLPPRPTSAVLLLAGIALLLPAPAAGQDLDEIVRGIRRFRELQERFEEYDDARDRERDRERRDQPNVNPNAPGPGASPGLYGPNGQRGPDPRSGPAYGSGSPYGYGLEAPYGEGPSAPYGYRDFDGRGLGGPRSSYSPPRPGVGSTPTTSIGSPQGPSEATAYVMRNPPLRPARYRVDGLPGGAITVQVVDENESGGRRRDVRQSAEVDASQARNEAVQALEASLAPLRDLRYGLRWFSAEGLRGSNDEQRTFLRQIEILEGRAGAAARSLRPSYVAFASAEQRLLTPTGPGGADRLSAWTEADWAAVERDVYNYQVLVRANFERIGRKSAWFAVKIRELERLDVFLTAAMERLRTARGQLRRPDAVPWPGEVVGGRPAGGEDRLRLYALAARLTENTNYLLTAAAADPLLPIAVAPNGVGLMEAAERVDATARDLAATLAEGADSRTVSAADAAFESAWAAWNGARDRAGLQRVGEPGAAVRDQKLLTEDATAGGDEIAAAAAAIEAVHEALHAVVPQGGPPRDGGAAAAAAAQQTVRAMTAFETALPRGDLGALRRQSHQSFLAAASQLSAAVGYYAQVVRAAPVGSPAERRARDVLDAAVRESADGLNDLANSGRRDPVAGAARDLLSALSAWEEAVRAAN
ncbi:collagen-like domain-containing protein [Alienimonas californiensis]|uniref:Outer membrane efflux protein n=1 Tax=Alienimonas californiensis TaxID=2527989 RepID=A0A517P7V1_9PLAN|nr:hypothetical protein [Alienimonas californiensis]QDT15456.1 hypothetical protein CA12_15410 [Alienimonas californiensis]